MIRIVGNGMIAKVFNNFKSDSTNCLIFASGVSDSTCKDPNQFIREELLLKNELKSSKENEKFLYFSTCSIYEKLPYITPYVKHKLEMEKLVLENPNGIVYRLPQIGGASAPKNNLMSKIKKTITSRSKFTIWSNATRNILDIEDVLKISKKTLNHSNDFPRILNIANPNSYKVSEILDAFQKVFNCKIDCDYVERGFPYKIDISDINYIIKDLKIDFSNYLERIIMKYYY